jgi:hypothetical protein
VLPEENLDGGKDQTNDVLPGLRGESSHEIVPIEACHGHQLCQIQKLITILYGSRLEERVPPQTIPEMETAKQKYIVLFTANLT